jgi:hypothetical protein
LGEQDFSTAKNPSREKTERTLEEYLEAAGSSRACGLLCVARMSAKRFFILAAALPFACACSDGDDDNAAGTGGASATSGAGNFANAGTAGGGAVAGAGASATDDDALVVPRDITVVPLAGGTGDLGFIALTLRDGPMGLEAYAALKNNGVMAACSGGLTLQLFDENQQTLGANISGLLSQHLYRFTDDTGGVAACVGPGDVTMAAVFFGTDIARDDVAFVEYSSTYFARDATPIDGFTVTQLESVSVAAGTSFKGTFDNGLDMTVNTPSVVVFPVNRVGRPLAMAIAQGTDPVPTGGTWAFQTDAVDAAGTDQAAYPTAVLPN